MTFSFGDQIIFIFHYIIKDYDNSDIEKSSYTAGAINNGEFRLT